MYFLKIQSTCLYIQLYTYMQWFSQNLDVITLKIWQFFSVFLFFFSHFMCQNKMALTRSYSLNSGLHEVQILAHLFIFRLLAWIHTLFQAFFLQVSLHPWNETTESFCIVKRVTNRKGCSKWMFHFENSQIGKINKQTNKQTVFYLLRTTVK